MTQFYVYCLIDESTNQPFYVGKGQGDRMYKHRYDAMFKRDGIFVNNKPHHVHIRKMVAAGVNIVYVVDSMHANATHALNRERLLIETIGRVVTKTGPLLNISRGGQTGGETCKPVSQYSLAGDLLSTYPSAKVASESVSGANRSYITQCCKKKRVSAGGFLWTYEGELPDVYGKRSHSAVHQLAKDGALIQTFASLTDAERVTGVTKHNISQCCRGKSKTAGGYIWKYILPV